PEFDRLRPTPSAFSSLSASAALFPALASPATTEIVQAEAVDGAYFPTLGVAATMGRVIQPADGAEGARVAVLSQTVWRQRFASNPAVIGQTVRIAGQRFDVVGVVPPSYDGANGSIPGTRVWIPRSADPSAATRKVVVFGRLKPSATVAGASAELAARSAQIDRDLPLKPNFE